MSLTDYELLISTNDIYSTRVSRWKYLYDSYMGGDQYKKGQYLNHYVTESKEEYAARIQATPLDNQCSSVISVYNSFLFREEPEREFGSLENLPELLDFLRDADFENRSLNNFMKEVSTWANVFGHCWVMVCKPNVGAITRADEQELSVRPYVSLMNPIVVLDWKWDRLINGRYVLSYLKYVEEINGDVRTIKEWYADRIITSIVDDNRKELQSQEEEVNGIGMIPAVIAYSQRSIVRGIGKSSIDDIADMQRFIYNALSEVDQSIRLDSHPSLVVTQDTEVGAGAGSLIKIDPSMPESVKPFVLDFDGANINNIYAAINNTIESIDKIANIGSVRATESKTMSGVAMETEFQLLNARLSDMADNLELAEEQIWRLFCIYQNQPFEIEIEYPGSFSIRDTGAEIERLGKASSAATDPIVKRVVDRKILEWMDLPEEETQIAMDEMQSASVELNNVDQ